MKAVTHDGSFHADDVFAYAVLRAAVPDLALERTRDPNTVARADLVFDVGGLYDPRTRRFDHHMRDRPLREDGTPYSSLGLLWREYGRSAIPALLGAASADVVEAVWRELDGSLVVEIDRTDNGIGDAGAGAGHLSSVIEAFNPVWDQPGDQNQAFMAAADLARGILARQCRQVAASERAKSMVFAASRSAHDPRIVVLDRKLPWEAAVYDGGLSEALYVIYPDEGPTRWYCRSVSVAQNSFDQRLPLPDRWAGLRDREFSQAAGIPDGVFCHPSRFICAATSRASAIALAQRSIAAAEL
jgi:uncharacterized UPF0160 family protein